MRREEEIGRPEAGERRVSRVEVPVEVHGVDAGLMPVGRGGGTVEDGEGEGDVGEGLVGV
jgi:hypothetical protein